MSYNTKNYTEQGGDVTHIGGKLVIDEGGSIEGLPQSSNVPESTADTVAGLKDDFNSLLAKLKDAGYVEKDEFNIDSNLIPTPTEADLTFNHSKVESVECENDVIEVKVDVDALRAYPSSNPAQGTHKWLGLEIKTGLSTIVGITYNGDYVLTPADATEAASVGCSDGSFVLYIKAEVIAENDRVITLAKSGYREAYITIKVINTHIN